MKKHIFFIIVLLLLINCSQNDKRNKYKEQKTKLNDEKNIIKEHDTTTLSDKKSIVHEGLLEMLIFSKVSFKNRYDHNIQYHKVIGDNIYAVYSKLKSDNNDLVLGEETVYYMSNKKDFGIDTTVDQYKNKAIRNNITQKDMNEVIDVIKRVKEKNPKDFNKKDLFKLLEKEQYLIVEWVSEQNFNSVPIEGLEYIYDKSQERLERVVLMAS